MPSSTAIKLHLQANLTPPVSRWYARSARRALKLYEADKPDRRVLLPTGRMVSAGELVERWNLHRIAM